MKILNLFGAFIIVLISFSISYAGNKDGRILLYANLTAGQEVPVVKNRAKGLVTFTLEEDYKTMTIYGVFDSLSGPVTNCHFHIGSFGVSGNVVLNLMPLVKGNLISGKVTITPLILQLIDVYGLYINVHTAANPAGEMRGQVYYDSDTHFWTIMQGGNEVPGVTTPAIGLASFISTADGTKLEYKILVTGLSGPITSAHLHLGDEGKVGPIAYTLNSSGNVLSGTLDVGGAFIDSLYRELVYVNVHTAANPGGEIRGQVSYSGQIAFDAFATGAGETVPTNSKGKSIAVAWLDPALDTMTYLVLYDSITPTSGHFHLGAKGTNGAVIFPFTPTASPGFVGRVAVRPDTLSKIIKGELYLNLHTSASPGGEIRGQSNSNIREALIANLCAKQEVPPTNSSAIGVGILSLDRNKTNAHIELVTNGLTGNATSGHIHIGAKGVAAGVAVNLGITGATGNGVSGVFLVNRTTFADTLISGLGYYNVHTTANPGGEIRGQITKTLQDDCLSVGINELRIENFSATIYPNPMNEIAHLEFNSKNELKGQVLISDPLGRIISQEAIVVLRGKNQINLNVESLNTGIYFIQLRSNNLLLFSEKVIKR